MPENNTFPESILENPGRPYVYFDSLPDDILNKVSEYFSKNINSFTNLKTNTSSIDDAFNFIRSAIATERAKEEARLAANKNATSNEIPLC